MYSGKKACLVLFVGLVELGRTQRNNSYMQNAICMRMQLDSNQNPLDLVNHHISWYHLTENIYKTLYETIWVQHSVVWFVCWSVGLPIRRKQNRESTKEYSKSRVKTWQVRGIWSQQLEHKQLPQWGTEPGVRKGKRSLLACSTRCKCSMEIKPLIISEGQARYKGREIGGKSDW